VYYVFDVMTVAGRDIMNEPLSARRKILSREIMPNLRDPIRESQTLDACLPDLIQAVKAQGLEGLVAKRVSLLGMRRMTGLVLTLSMSKFLNRAGSQAPLRRCWRHNLACALAAKEFAHSFGRDENEAYNAGLFHDVGRLAFLVLEPALYSGPLRTDADLQELERARFGVDHCEAGAWLLEHWKLPQIFVDVARHHHAPKPEGAELTMLVNAACVIANRLGFCLVQVEPEEIELDLSDDLGANIADMINSLEREYGFDTPRTVENRAGRTQCQRTGTEPARTGIRGLRDAESILSTRFTSSSGLNGLTT
jgi:putative nucleotidyltransferase with HDIG domain